MRNIETDIQSDVKAIGRISIVPMLLDVICRTTGMGFAAIARVTEDRWVTCSVLDKIAFGLKPGDELKVESTICHEIRQSEQAVIINHVATDPLYANHHTPALYGFQSYISVPITRKDGGFFGTLCAIDPKPAKVNTPEINSMFILFADLIAFHLHALEEMDATEAKLVEERRIAELREQLIAVLGHDLRNPVATTRLSIEALLQKPLTADIERIVNIIRHTNHRMEELVDNMMDFARGRMGDGITLNTARYQDGLKNTIQEIITEMQTVSPNKAIHGDFDIQQVVVCDINRIGQLFSNLLSNAVTHGASDSPIFVRVVSCNDIFTLSVTNAGSKISDVILDNLFIPFSRSKAKPGSQGLGLGLYIASEIARAHQGHITVQSTDKETCFTFQMPALTE